MSSPSRAAPAAPPRRAPRPARQLLGILVLALTACHATTRPATVPQLTPIQQLQHDIDAILAAPALEHSFWGVLVMSLAHDADGALYSLNARKLLMPASNMKIVTLGAAAERLGWDYRYETRLVASGSIEGGTLSGDLVVVGSGDPSIVSPDGTALPVFDSWADQLVARGLRRIDGRIVGDDNAFDDETLGTGWTWEDLAEGYAGGVSALQFNDSVVHATVVPGLAVGDAAIVSLAPVGSGLVVRNELETTAAGTPSSIEARRLPGGVALELRGSVAIDSAPRVRVLSVDNPTLFFVTALRRALIGHGIDVRGPAVDVDEIARPRPPSDGPPLLTHHSPPLSDLAVTLMKVSLNFDAETFLKTLGARAGTPTFGGGLAEARSVVDAWGVEPGGLIMRDGSGLSRYNYVTAQTLVTILTHIDRDDRLREPFERALPIAGRDGTLARRMKGTPAEGNARAKTGSFASARALSGYVRTADGEPLVFSILGNNFDTPAAAVDQACDAIVVRLARFTRAARTSERGTP